MKAQLGQFEDSEHWTRQAAEAFRELADPTNEASVRLQLGDLYRLRGVPDAAIHEYEASRRIYEATASEHGRAVASSRIADIDEARGELDEAIEHQRLKLDLCRPLGFSDGIASAQFDLAQLELAKRQPEHVLECLQESFLINQKRGRPDGIAVVGQFLGSILHQRKHPEAKEVLQLALAAARKLNDPELVEAITGLLDK